MRLIHSALLLSLSLLYIPNPISAHFFTNVSSIPPWLNATGSNWESFHNLSGHHFGQSVDGLNRLKSYFHYFGYINGTSNFTDDFDDALKSAVETYQKNFNLNVTGTLDNHTVQQIIKPRCGVADIVNGTSAMNSGKSNNATSSFLSIVARYAFFPGEPRWPEGHYDLTYAFNPEENITNEIRGVFARAFDRWSSVTPLTFELSTSPNSADITIGFFNGEHGDGEPFDGILGTLAHAFSPPSGRFHLDAAESWVVDDDVNKSTSLAAIDLESVAVHEIGHLLGLGHSSVEESIMYPAITTRTRKVELQSDDIMGIQYLYGANPAGNNGSSTPSSGRETSDGGGALISSSLLSIRAFLAVGFGFLLFF
ncbi:metalloendoproteinase 2-MMP-like [Quercus lobata]|uniref:Peptidase metallopeptidase domain-containing protein n=1 Tax=Quercus lobata TaxID=97700 RepID=A0A7N2R1Y9_QUELO|nr:metalloendoproteinase 2-MMP-like [Quercus lobata]